MMMSLIQNHFLIHLTGTKLVLDWGDDDPETYTVEISDNSLKLIEEGGHTETFTKQ